jgi:Flp pilus assembly protein TadD
MPIDRVEALNAILRENPSDPLARYGLAMELVKQGAFEAAVAEFRTLLRIQPSHAYAYFHTGQTLEKLGRRDEARCVYQDGVEAASRKGDTHARSELEAAIALLPPENS